MKTPILFNVFNRPDTTKKVFESIKSVKPQRLYLACDGPRQGNLNDNKKICQVKKIIEKINWECKVYKLFREENLGCKLAISEAINWFFEKEKEGIILEDDTLPSESFYEFCEIMLEKYQDKKVIMHIGGYKPKNIDRDQYSISFTRATHIWGWATWKDRWNLYNKEIISEHNLKLLQNYEYFLNEKKTRKRIKILRKISSGEIDTWDYQWNYAIRSNSGLAIRPCVNLVQNIGLAHKDATHTLRNNIMFL